MKNTKESRHWYGVRLGKKWVIYVDDRSLCLSDEPPQQVEGLSAKYALQLAEETGGRRVTITATTTVEYTVVEDHPVTP